ncbi:MAG: DUF839 domain-containing protein [Magnetovibrio sp.]|nr:DUF839 domain-containing protein [Magnetovibrio sp.]
MKLFFTTPRGAEHCGPCFDSDDTAYFTAVQHPGDTKGATFKTPSTRWPGFQNDQPVKPSMMVITKQGGAIFVIFVYAHILMSERSVALAALQQYKVMAYDLVKFTTTKQDRF